jgi:hypothetical protein
MDESATPKHLASLKLLGNLSLLPKWITLLNDLTKVWLLGTKLEQGQVDILGTCVVWLPLVCGRDPT